MYRREFIAVLGGAVAAWPLDARAQDPTRKYRVGFLLPTLRDSAAVVALFDELRLNGFIDGENLSVVPGGFGVQNDQIPSVVASLVAASPHVNITGAEVPLRPLQQATPTIPLLWTSQN